jgi:hypothetical protein
MKPGVQTIEGVVPGGTAHLILLALRGAGGMNSEQLCARFGDHQSGALHRLKGIGLIDMPAMGNKGKTIRLTDTGRALTEPDGPLSRRKTLITYCQL